MAFRLKNGKLSLLECGGSRVLNPREGTFCTQQNWEEESMKVSCAQARIIPCAARMTSSPVGPGHGPL